VRRDEFVVPHPDAAEPLPVNRAERGWRGVIAALMTRLMNAWVRLYAPPPRRSDPRL
jgi:hypothetical protein